MSTLHLLSDAVSNVMLAAPAAPTTPPAGSGIGSFIPTTPNWGAVSGFGPIVSAILGIAAAIAAVISLIHLGIGLVQLAGSNRHDSNERALGKIKKNGVIVLVAGFAAFFLLRFVLGLVQTALPGVTG